MRSVLNFISLLALGLIVSAVILAAPGDSPQRGDIAQLIDGSGWSIPALDYQSVVAGLAIGVLIALIAQISWVEVARRTAGWIASQAHRLIWLSLAAVLVGVIIYV